MLGWPSVWWNSTGKPEEWKLPPEAESSNRHSWGTQAGNFPNRLVSGLSSAPPPDHDAKVFKLYLLLSHPSPGEPCALEMKKQ